MSDRYQHFPPVQERWSRPADYVPLATMNAPAELPSPTEEPHAAETPNIPKEQTPGRVESREKQPRVTLSGRLGSPVRYGATPKGQPKAHFVLGVHTLAEGGVKTDWHQVLTFGERVAQLRELNLGKGEAARVIGYVHTRQGATGKIVEEVYATVISRL